MMEEEKSEQSIFLKMAHLCSKSEQCTPDIIKRIRELGGSGEMTESIVNRLVKENYLNDQRFVSLYVREKFRLNKWGRVKMHYYLKMKGLKEELIQSGFSEIDEDDYVALLIKTMKEKAKTIRSTDKYEKMGQIIRFTQGRGFEPELIHRYLNRAIT
jgi:regulatory protein